MKIFNSISKAIPFMMLCSTGLAGVSGTLQKEDLAKIFQKPLILGASVSGDFLTASPGRRLSLRYTTADQILTVAKNGRPGRETLSLLDEGTLRGRTIMVGVDLFFWDSFAKNPAEGLNAIDKLLEIAAREKIWLVLGQIPLLMPKLQIQAAVLNASLKQACSDYPQCRLLPLGEILQKVVREGGIEQDGRHYSLPELLPDGLHISAPASEYLANRIVELL